MKSVFSVFCMCLFSWSALGAGSYQNKAFIDGNELLKVCEINDRGACQSYIVGVTDGMLYFFGDNLDKSKTICLPSNVSGSQITDVTIKHVKDHPVSRNLNAAQLIFTAILLAFPCI
mgnify:CR=1 FL=1